MKKAGDFPALLLVWSVRGVYGRVGGVEIAKTQQVGYLLFEFGNAAR